MYESGPDVTRVVLMYEYRRSKTNSTVIRIKLDCPPSILTLNRNPYSQVTRTLILNLPARGKSMILPSYFPNMLFTQTVIYKFSKFNSIFLDDLLTILETVQYHIFRPSRSICLDRPVFALWTVYFETLTPSFSRLDRDVFVLVLDLILDILDLGRPRPGSSLFYQSKNAVLGRSRPICSPGISDPRTSFLIVYY